MSRFIIIDIYIGDGSGGRIFKHMKEEINSAIAEYCGYKLTPLPQNPKQFAWVLNGFQTVIPNYEGDLNAMNEAEKTLTDQEYDLFEEFIYDYAADSLPLVQVGGFKIAQGFIRAVSVSAAYRAEAFCRALKIGPYDTRTD